MSKLAVLFPGIGYTCHKPLLYYSRKVLMEQDYEVIQIEYQNLPGNVKGNIEKMKQAYEMAYEQTEKQLVNIEWNSYEDVVFVSKSIGTVVAAKYTTEHIASARNFYMTPVEWTFDFLSNKDCIIFHGTKDPWADTMKIRNCCQERNLDLCCVENANHSLEVGNSKNDLDTLAFVMKKLEEYIKN